MSKNARSLFRNFTGETDRGPESVLNLLIKINVYFYNLKIVIECYFSSSVFSLPRLTVIGVVSLTVFQGYLAKLVYSLFGKDFFGFSQFLNTYFEF